MTYAVTADVEFCTARASRFLPMPVDSVSNGVLKDRDRFKIFQPCLKMQWNLSV